MYNKINLNPQMLAGLARNAKGQISCIFLHWSAGYYGQSFKDYHLCIDGDGKVYSMCFNLTDKKAHTWHRNTGSVGIAMNCCWGASIRRKSDEEKDAERLSQISDNRDQGSDNPPAYGSPPDVGHKKFEEYEHSCPSIREGCPKGGVGSQQKYVADWGNYPPTPQQIMSMAYAVACICFHAELPINASTVMTHAEIAKVDNYGIDSDDPEKKWDLLVLPGYQESGGEVIRKLAKAYLAKMIKDRDELSKQLANK